LIKDHRQEETSRVGQEDSTSQSTMQNMKLKVLVALLYHHMERASGEVERQLSIHVERAVPRPT
jgi:hypothetical protein